MTTSKRQTALELLQRTRNQVGMTLGGVFLVYALLLYQFYLNTLIPSLRPGVWYGVGLSVVFIIAHGVGWFRNRWVSLVLYGLIIPLLWYMAYQFAIQKVVPATILLWSTILMPLFFLMLGSKTGALVVGTFIAGLLAIVTVIVSPAVVLDSPYHLAWMTGLMAILATSLLNFILLRFIEQNLLLQDQTHNELEAAKLDALTGLPGRASIEDTLKTALHDARRNKTPLSIVVTDIDHFKRVNDTHGHKMGDEVLQGFSKRLRRSVGSGGIVGRWGGEEFLIVLPGISRQDALATAEHLRSQVSISPIAGLDITASFGVASYRSAGDDMKALFGRADERLYEAKSAGRDAVR